MVTLTLIAFLLSLAAALVIVRGGWGRSVRYGDHLPQRFHTGSVSRLGGVALATGTVGGWSGAALLDGGLRPINAGMSAWHAFVLLLVCLPAVGGGVVEDLTQRLRVSLRLVLTGVTATLGCALLDLAVPRLGIPWLDAAMATTPAIGVALAFIAICGLPHAFNIVDGYNGLAGFVALAVCAALIHVCLQLGDRQLAAILVSVAAATVAFLFLNYPRGLIFAGDGGAYLWGVVISIASIALVQRHAEVSPWFPMLLLIYPVWETLFSIYRKSARGHSPGVADALHFHQLIYRRIVRGTFHDDAARKVLMRNNRTSPYLWGFTMLTVVPAVMFWSNTLVLVSFCVLFVATYVWAYLSIVRFRVPRWLRR